MRLKSALPLLLSLWLTGLGPGCGSTPVIKVKRIGDRVTSAEIDAFLAVIDSLPERKLPAIAGVIPLPPHWSSGRTLPIRELLQEEQHLLDERLTVPVVTAQLPQPKMLERALRREGMTYEQFTNLVIVLGAALNRAVADDDVLSAVIEKGTSPLLSLQSDTRVFSELSDEHAFIVLDKAAWIPAVNRAQFLSQVPAENVALVRERLKDLQAVFPPEFSTDPFASFQRMLLDERTPFEELPETGSDESLTWDAAEAEPGTADHR